MIFRYFSPTLSDFEAWPGRCARGPTARRILRRHWPQRCQRGRRKPTLSSRQQSFIYLLKRRKYEFVLDRNKKNQ